MQVYDLAMLLVIVGVTLFGAIKGFAWQVASLASIVVSYFVAFYFRNDVAQMIKAQHPWNIFLGMLLLYVGTTFVIWVVFRLMSGTIDRVRLKDFDRHLGAVFGFGKGIVYCLLITMFAMALLGPNQQQMICESRSGYYMSKILASAEGIVLPVEIEQIVRPRLEQLEQQLNQSRSGGVFSSSPSKPTSSLGVQPTVSTSPNPGQGWEWNMPGYTNTGSNVGQDKASAAASSNLENPIRSNSPTALPPNPAAWTNASPPNAIPYAPQGGTQPPLLNSRQAEHPADWNQSR